MDADWSFGLFRVPGFGYGLVLVLWVLFGGYWLYRNRQELQLGTVLFPVLVWGAAAFAIVNVPSFVQKGPRSVIAQQSNIIDQQVKSAQLADHYVTRGLAYQQVYEYGEAAKDFQSAIELAPNRDASYLQLAWLRATCADPEFRDGGKAVNLAQTAIEKADSKTAQHWDTLAAAYAESGNFSEAERTCEKAARYADASSDMLMRERLPEIRQRLADYRDHEAYAQPRFVQAFPQSLPIRGYGFMMFVGFLSAGVTATWLARRVGIPGEVIWDLGIWALFSGIVGARLFYLVQYHDRVFGGKSGLDLLKAPFELQEGGLVLLGGVLCASALVIGYCYRRKLKPLLIADIAVPGFFLALAFGAWAV